MPEFDFEETTAFWNVGMLKALLAPYPDATPIYVCGINGLFCPDEESQSILIDTMGSSGLEALEDFPSPATGEVEYMDF